MPDSQESYGWLLGTSIAVFGLFLAIMTYISQYLFPASEGKKLGDEIDALYHRIDRLEDDYRETLKDLGNKIDSLYHLILEKLQKP